MAEGSSCRYTNLIKDKNKIDQEILKRKNYAKKALKILGVKAFSFYDNKCGSLSNIPQLKLNKIIEKEIEDFKPNIIFTHSNKDLNKDHRAIFDSVLVSTRPLNFKYIETIYSFEILSITEWYFNNNFKQNYYISLSKKDILQKWAALRVYKSEIKPKPHPRSFFGIESLSRYRGIQCGNLYAEAFEIIRKFN